MPILKLKTDIGFPKKIKCTPKHKQFRISKKTGDTIYLSLAGPDIAISSDQPARYPITIEQLKIYVSLPDLADLNSSKLGIYEKVITKPYILEHNYDKIHTQDYRDISLQKYQKIIIEYIGDQGNLNGEEITIYTVEGKYLATIYDKDHEFFSLLS